MTSTPKLSKDIRRGVLSHIIRLDLLYRQEFRNSFISATPLGDFKKRASNRSRTLWDIIVARSEAYLSDQPMVTSDIHLVTGVSRATTGRCIKLLEEVGIFKLKTDPTDLRRTLVELTEPCQKVLNNYVEECFEEFKDLITHHHDRERHIAESSLQESEERFKATFEQAAVGIAHVSPDGRILRINQRFCDITGYTNDYLIGRTFLDITHPADLYINTKNVGRLLNGEISNYSTEKRYIRPDGSHIWANLTVALVRSADDSPAYFVSVIESITERKRSEEKIRNSEKLFRTIFDQVAVGVALIDTPTGSFEKVNQRYCNLVGYSQKELSGMTFQILTHPDDLQLDLDNMQRLVKGEIREFTMEKRYYHKDGSIIWGNLTVSPTWQPGEAPDQHIAIIEDISQKKHAEDALQESARQNKLIINTVHDLIWLKNVKGTYLTCNHIFEQFFGAKEAEIVGKTDYDFVDKEVADSFRRYDIEAMNAGKSLTYEEWVTFADNGLRVLLKTTKTPLKADDGTILGILGVGHDITERKKA